MRKIAVTLLPVLAVLAATAQQSEPFKDPDEQNCVVTPFSALTTPAGKFQRDVKERSSTQTLQIGERVELTITQSGCAHYFIGISVRWLNGAPPAAAAIREATAILKQLKEPEGQRMVAMLAELLRKTPVSKLGKEQSAGEFASVVVAFEKGQLTLSYSFAA